MKTKLLLFLSGLLLMVGCAATDTVAQAEQKWADHTRLQTPPLYAVARVDRERRMLEKLRLRSDVEPWCLRKAELNLITEINEAMIPNIPQPPGRGSVQPNPFQ